MTDPRAIVRMMLTIDLEKNEANLKPIEGQINLDELAKTLQQLSAYYWCELGARMGAEAAVKAGKESDGRTQ